MYRCKRCGAHLASSSNYCISCYRDLTTLCLYCHTTDKRGHPKKRGKPIFLKDGKCAKCNGEGWIFKG